MDFIKRKLYGLLETHLQEHEITLLLGPRQVGKTTLLTKLAESLRDQGHPVLFLNLDIERDFAHVRSQAHLLQYIHLQGGNRKCYVFIDEIQRKKNAGRFMKGIYDMGLRHKFILSGSGSLELKEDLVESLAGRKRIFELNPVSFLEFTDFRTSYRFSDNIEEWLDYSDSERTHLFNEYLIFGGYPKVILADTQERKKLVLAEIYRSYIERDINSIINIDKPQAFGQLFQIAATIAGNHINYTSISKKVALSDQTVKQYLWYMEKTFMIKLVRPFYQNVQKEIVKSPQLYFNDLGICSYALDDWNNRITNTRLGMAFQNLIYNEIRSIDMTNETIKYWRTKDGAEVDLVLGSINQPIPVEIKFSSLNKIKLTRGLKRFISTYHPEKAFLVNTSFGGELIYNSSHIIYLPYWKMKDIYR